MRITFFSSSSQAKGEVGFKAHYEASNLSKSLWVFVLRAS